MEVVIINWVTIILENLPAIAAIVTTAGLIVSYFKRADRKELITAISETSQVVTQSIQQNKDYRNATDEEKKAAAKRMIAEILSKRKISVDDETISVFVESAVWAMKNVPEVITGITELTSESLEKPQ